MQGNLGGSAGAAFSGALYGSSLQTTCLFSEQFSDLTTIEVLLSARLSNVMQDSSSAWSSFDAAAKSRSVTRETLPLTQYLVTIKKYILTSILNLLAPNS